MGSGAARIGIIALGLVVGVAVLISLVLGFLAPHNNSH